VYIYCRSKYILSTYSHRCRGKEEVHSKSLVDYPMQRYEGTSVYHPISHVTHSFSEDATLFRKDSTPSTRSVEPSAAITDLDAIVVQSDSEVKVSTDTPTFSAAS